jgi:hypothetical protein
MRDARMANKLPQDRETIVFHFGNGDSSDPIITEEQIEHAKARERREAELRGLRSRMRRSGWHCCEDIAKNYDLGQEDDIYRKLLAGLRSEKFDEFGVLFLNSDPRGQIKQRVTKAMVENMVEIFGLDTDEKNPRSSSMVVGFLRHCWMPDALYRRFFDEHLRQFAKPPMPVGPSSEPPKQRGAKGKRRRDAQAALSLRRQRLGDKYLEGKWENIFEEEKALGYQGSERTLRRAAGRK